VTRRGNGEGTICQRADGRWVAAVSLGGTRRKWLYGATRQQVAEKLTSVLRSQQQGLPVAQGREPLAAYLMRWLETVRPTLRVRTWERYEQILRVHVLPELGRTPLARLGPEQVQRMYASRLEAGSSAMTVRHVHAVLHRALKQALRWGLVPRNVVELADPPRAPRHEIRTLNEGQTRALLDGASGDRLEGLYVVAVTTGMRQGELLALRWRALDLETASLQVRATLQRSREGVAFAEPKTNSSRRRITLTKAAVAALRRHKVRQAEERLRLGEGWSASDLVFTNTAGHPIDGSDLLRSFHALLAGLGLPRIRFHDLRHTAATLLLGRGVHPKIVSEQLGHAQIAITLDTYSHVTPTMQREAAEVLDALLGGVS
jgi:integrase